MTSITTEQFKSLVAKDVRKESDELVEVLSSDYRLWLDELNVLLRDVEIQLTAQKGRISEKKVQLGPEWNNNDWYSFKASEDKWKVTALRFKASVEERIRFVKTLRAKKYMSAQ
jgi:hypothetical protein